MINSAFVFISSALTMSIGLYAYNCRKKIYTDGEIVSGRIMNMFGPNQYLYIGDEKHIWSNSMPIDQEVENSDNFYFKYTNEEGGYTLSTKKGEIEVDKSIFKYKQISEEKVKFPWNYCRMKRPLHLGLNTLDDQGVEFDNSFRGRFQNCFVSSILEAMIDMQGYDNQNSYNRVYKVKFPNDARVKVYHRIKNNDVSYIGDKAKYLWCSDKVIIEEIPSDKYVEYIKKDYINLNKGVTDEERKMVLLEE